MAQQGLGVMRSPLGATFAILLQVAGWVCQLFAVWAAMRAFHIHAPIPAAARRAAADERRDRVPALARQRRARAGRDRDAARRSYGVAYAHGVAYGFGLQAIEASVGIGVGLLFLAREGLSFAMLRVMPSRRRRRCRSKTNEEQLLMPRPGALACPASLKASSRRAEAAAALEDGFADAGVECVPVPLADGGEGTVDALCDLVGYVEAEDAYGRARTPASAGATARRSSRPPS